MGLVKLESDSNTREPLTLVFVYSGDYAERVIRNLINDPSFCTSCGLYCNNCKYGAYSFVENVRAAIHLPPPSELPSMINHPEDYLPQKIPKADLCIASGLHPDLLLELPYKLRDAGIRGLVVPIEDFTEVPSGLKNQLEGICQELGLESSFPKPFCSLQPSQDKPTISRLATELNIGRPSLQISTVKRGDQEVIDSVVVKRSAPCGSTWYIAQKLKGVKTTPDILYDAVAKAHHSYPCTATMSVDPETEEPILHIGGFIIREEVNKALKKNSE